MQKGSRQGPIPSGNPHLKTPDQHSTINGSFTQLNGEGDDIFEANMTSTIESTGISSTDGAEIQGGIPEIDVSENDHDRLTEYPESVDYYSLLALGREPTPTDAQIRSAYRKLTLSFHPDKQPPNLRVAATRQYDKIRTAYETLIDPKKRVVYDMLGEEGVKAEWGLGGAMRRRVATNKQEVGVKAMDTEEFRRWFLMRMRRRERKMLEDMVQVKV